MPNNLLSISYLPIIDTNLIKLNFPPHEPYIIVLLSYRWPARWLVGVFENCRTSCITLAPRNGTAHCSNINYTKDTSESIRTYKFQLPNPPDPSSPVTFRLSRILLWLYNIMYFQIPIPTYMYFHNRDQHAPDTYRPLTVFVQYSGFFTATV